MQDTTFYAVSYVEVAPSARPAAVAALKQFRDASRKDAGFVRMEFFEQIGWPGHISVIETWTDQKSFDSHSAAVHTKDFLGRLQPIRVSGYDQRPYKTLSIGAKAPAADGRNVHIVSHVDIAPSAGDATALLRQLAEESRKENGNLRFDVMQHTMRANHFTVLESWQSQEARDAHAAAAQTKKYRDTVQPMTGSPLDERIYKVVE